MCSGCTRCSGWVEDRGRGAPLIRATALRTRLSPSRSHLDKLAAQVSLWAGSSVSDCLGLRWGLSLVPQEDHWVVGETLVLRNPLASLVGDLRIPSLRFLMCVLGDEGACASGRNDNDWE